jgi:hypothetical protein
MPTFDGNDASAIEDELLAIAEALQDRIVQSVNPR